MIQLGSWVLFPTDLLFLSFIAMITGLVVNNRHNFKFQKVAVYLFQKPIIMVSSIIFMSYLLVAVLDCIHVQSGHAISSVLDKSLAPLNTFYETTYSEPLSTYSYSKQVVFNEQTQSAHQVFKPLAYTQHQKSILSLICFGLLQGILLCLSLLGLLALWSRNHAGFRTYYSALRDQSIAIGTAMVTFSVLILLLSVVGQLTSHYHLLGTDKVGQDVFYQVIKSIRTAFIIGFLTSFILLPFAIVLGISAGYFGKRVDDVIQYMYTVISSVPGVLLIAAGFLSLQIMMNRHAELFPSSVQRAEFKLLMLCIIMGLTSWTSLCRLVRAETLKLKQIDYVQAAKTIGSSHRIILFKHILPNLMHIVIIATALDFSGLVLAETVLSYIGIGVDPTLYSWGLTINAARLELAREPLVWWPLLSAFFMMFCLVLSANIVADALRDALDPKVN